MKFPRRSSFCKLLTSGATALLLAVPTGAFAQDSVDLNERYDAAVRRAQRGDVSGAIEIFKEITVADPNWSDAVYNVADLAQQTGRAEDCAVYFRRYLYLEPDDSEAGSIRAKVAECEQAMAGSGQITITSTTPDSLPVAIDGFVFADGAQGPWTVSAGSHTITAQRADFDPFTTTVDVDAGAGVEVAVALVPITYFGDVTLDVSVAGASVSCDGAPAGTAPLAAPLHLAVGRYLIEIAAPGYHPWRRYVEVNRDDELSVRAELIDESVNLDDL